MAKEIKAVRDFLEKAKNKSATSVTIVKKTRDRTKFKIRAQGFLWTLSMTEASKAKVLEQSLPPTLEKKIIISRRKK